MSRLIKGVGYNSKRTHNTHENNKISKAYVLWHHMIQRCYEQNPVRKNKSYVGCSVDRRWHDFQDFADWLDKQPHKECDYQLDKDLLVPSNKIYSPDKCVLIPQELNSLLTDRKAARGAHPQGVDFLKRNQKYRARISINSKSKHIGYFNCPHEAHQAYRVAKELYVKEKALEWRGRIDTRVFNALMNWSLGDE